MASLGDTQPKTSKEEEAETYIFAMQVAMGTVLPVIVQAASELDVLRLL